MFHLHINYPYNNMCIENRVITLIEKYIHRIQCIQNKPIMNMNDQQTIDNLYVTINYLTKQLFMANVKAV